MGYNALFANSLLLSLHTQKWKYVTIGNYRISDLDHLLIGMAKGGGPDSRFRNSKRPDSRLPKFQKSQIPNFKPKFNIQNFKKG